MFVVMHEGIITIIYAMYKNNVNGIILKLYVLYDKKVKAINMKVNENVDLDLCVA